MSNLQPIPPEGYNLGPHISIGAIQQAVCTLYGVNPIEMVSARRSRDVAHPRQVAMYLARELTPFSLPNIGRMFGKRDHTTIIHGIRNTERRMAEDAEVAADVDALKSSLQANSGTTILEAA